MHILKHFFMVLGESKDVSKFQNPVKKLQNICISGIK